VFPYDDNDLLALARARGLLAGNGPLPVAENWRGQLAPALCRANRLTPDGAGRLIKEIGRSALPCPGCGTRFCALPALRTRRVSCPECGGTVRIEKNAKGLPAEAWSTTSHTGAASHRERRATSSRSDATLMDTGPAAATRHDRIPVSRQGRTSGSSLNPSWIRNSSGLGAVPGSPNELSAGDPIGPYIILSELARGAMGIVFKAQHLHVADRLVAIKVMQSQFAEDEDLERFRREGQALARIDHPNVVGVHEMDVTEDGRPYMALDFVQGQTLKDLSDKGPMDPADVARVLEPVARGVAHLNDQHIIHRDLKLANVLQDLNGVPIIADFGLAHLQDRRTRLTEAGDLLGTPLYMAPEVILRDDEGFDARCDVYSLGVMAYRMIVGEFPYYSKIPTHLFQLVVEADLKLPEELSEDTKAILDRALARYPEARYQDSHELADDLRALANGERVNARRQTTEERLRRWIAKNPRLALGSPLILATLLTLTLAGGIAFRNHRRAEKIGVLNELSATLTTELKSQRRSKRALARIDKYLAQARTTLADSGDVGGDGTATRARLETLTRDLQSQRDRIHALVLLNGTDAAGFAGNEWASVVEAFGATTPASLEGKSGRAFEEERAWVLLASDEPAAARKLLEDVVSNDPRPVGPGDWNLDSDSPGRRRWRLAWAQARCGAPSEALATLTTAPATLRAELLLFLATTSDRPKDTLDTIAGLLKREKGAQANWLRIRLALSNESPTSPADLLIALEKVREFSDPANPTKLDTMLRARASAVEAQLLLDLGWHASAVEAFKRIGALAPRAVVRASSFRLGATHDVALPLEALGLFGEALARSKLLDTDAALATARIAVSRGRYLPARAQVAAGLLLVDALELAEDDAGATRVFDQLVALEVDGLQLEAARRRRSARRGDEPLAPGDERAAQRAEHFISEGEAELAAHYSSDAASKPSPEQLRRARRAFRLALGLGLADPRAAWGGLTRTELRAGRRDQAQAYAEKAAAGGKSAPPWTAALGVALTHAAAGDPEKAVNAILALRNRVTVQAGLRLLARRALEFGILREAERSLREWGHDAQALTVLRRLGELAEEIPATPGARFSISEAIGVRAEANNDKHLAATALAAMNAAASESLELTRLDDDIMAKYEINGRFGQNGEIEQAARNLIERNPTETKGYQTLYIYFLATKPEGYDLVSTSLEVAANAIVSLMRRDHLRQAKAQRGTGDWVAEALRGGMLRALDLFKTSPPLENMTFPCSRDIRGGLAILRVMISGAAVPKEKGAWALAVTERFYREHPGSLVGDTLTGHLRLELGDAAGALTYLKRSKIIDEPFKWDDSSGDAQEIRVAEARAWARLRNYDTAMEILKPSARWMNHPLQITEEKWFRDDWDDPKTLRESFIALADQVSERLAKELEDE
jgi:serine/threonine protein kinase